MLQNCWSTIVQMLMRGIYVMEHHCIGAHKWVLIKMFFKCKTIIKYSLIFWHIFKCVPSSLLEIMPLASNSVIFTKFFIFFWNACVIIVWILSSIRSIHFWVFADTVNVVKLLIANKANVNAVDNDGYSALYWAVLNGKLFNDLIIILYVIHRSPKFSTLFVIRCWKCCQNFAWKWCWSGYENNERGDGYSPGCRKRFLIHPVLFVFHALSKIV